ncbi:heparinase II/III domain-containing protein [Haloarchaeobius sp. DFWS5]|uniref:twin-arginine translocation signal domain-containing protein n=1 Tax=Haloarchaeobius sp. DFWS5 TaxID=3446114 RepID=UPI003EBE97C8
MSSDNTSHVGGSGASDDDWTEWLDPNLSLVADSLPVDRRDFLKASGVAALASMVGANMAGATPTDTAQKTRVTYYTNEERQAARDNIQQYDWAKDIRDGAVEDADTVLSTFSQDELWEYVTSQDVPRAGWLAGGNAGYYPGSGWDSKHPLSGFSYACEPGKQWKVTNGTYTLPTNDYEAYRKSGLDDAGKFDPDLADDSLLVNEEHPEMGAGWGVDDGTGWVDENGDLGPEGQRWVPVAWANHWFAGYGHRELAVALRDAYLYTGEQQYATAASVLLDRIADVYPELSLQDTVYFEESGYTYINGLPNNSHGGTGRGKVAGSIWESFRIKAILQAYDAVFPAQSGDDEMVSFLSEKEAEYPGIGSKSSVKDIRANIETGLIQEILPAFKDAQIRGNFGSHQTTLALSAVIQDDADGYTKDALDFLFKAGGLEYEDDGTPWGNWYITGGDVLSSLLTKFDRDGHPYEGTPHYNSLVASALQGTADALNGYDAYEGADLYQNPVFKQSFKTQHPITYLNEYVPKYGDTEGAGAPGFQYTIETDNLVRAYEVHGGDDLARWIYLRNDQSTDGLRGGIFDTDPNSVKDDIQAVLDAEGPLDIDSTQLAGLGFSALRAGDAENGRGVWTYYGRNAYGPDEGYGTSHCHRDTLNLGVFAHGLNLSPDLGYPEETGGWPKRRNWTSNTVSHNTVLVDENKQEKQWVSKPRFFDHTDDVQVFDVDASNVYDQCDAYERTTMQVAVDEEDSYSVDFFRVAGGDDHLFSFHGAKVPGDDLSYSLADGVSEFVVRNGVGSIQASTEKKTTGTWSTRVYDPDGDSHDWRGLAIDAGSSDVDVTVDINSAVTGYNDYWHHNHSVSLGTDDQGRRVVAGVGNQGADPAAKIGIYYPESNTWGDHDNMNDWEKGAWFSLSVTQSGTGVDVEFVDSSGSTHAAGSYTLDSPTDSQVGIFGGVGKGQTGALYFDDFQLDGSTVEFLDVEFESNTGLEIEGLSLTEQDGGTYAGPNVPKPGRGEDTDYNREVGNGYNYLYDVSRDDDPGAFSVDWDIVDYWDALDTDIDAHLRLTMLTECDDVAIASGNPPQRWGNPDKFRYALAHREGTDLDTTFTSVVEPYVDDRYVASISSPLVETVDSDEESFDDGDMQVASGPVAAVKVELTNGRTDYVVRTYDRDTVYTIDRTVQVQGEYAVVSVNDGEVSQVYLGDGTLVRPVNEEDDGSYDPGQPFVSNPVGRFEGTVEDFTRSLTLDNEITVQLAGGHNSNGGNRASIEDAVGRWVYCDAVDMRNGAYEITGVTQESGNRVTLSVGERTTVKEFTDSENPDAGYEYVLVEGGDCVVPLSSTWSA